MKKIYFLFLILILGCFFVWLEVFNFQKELKVVFFDVGQGDSIFIEKDSYQVLIDGGPNDKVLHELGKEMSLWDKEIDLVILTHPDYDHLNGLLEVLDNYDVQNVIWTGVVFDDYWEDWKSLLENEGCNVYIAKKEMVIEFDEVSLEILSPSYSLEEFSFKDLNNTSIVSKLSYGNVSFLLAGDIDENAEKYLIEEGINLTANVLKAAHHGSRTSNSLELIESVNPSIVVIQSGENNYGHPSEEVLSRFEKSGINILRNDTLGSISLFTNGLKVFVKQ